jgi:aminopeptidase YwaD
MTTLPNETVGEAYRSDRSWSTLERLVDGPDRMPGWDGERRAATLIADIFDEIGCRDVKTESFSIPGWWRGGTTLRVSTPSSDALVEYDGEHEVLALPGTPPGTIEGRLVDVGHGYPAEFEAADLEGNVALVSSASPPSADRWIHRIEKYGFAVEAGAAGFVFRNHIEGCLPPTGSINPLDGPAAIPGVGVSKEVGAQLQRRCERGVIETSLTVDCETGPAKSVNVSGALGPETEREVLVTAHLDAHDIGSGARDNGSGCAIVTEVGRLLASVADDLDTRVRLVAFGAEEVGLLGSRHWADRCDLDALKGVLNVDGVGQSRDLAVVSHRFDSIANAADATAADLGVPIAVEDEFFPHSDHWPFVRYGVPGVQLRSVSDDAGRGWGHTHGDTLDKLDSRDIRALSIAVADLTLKVASNEFAPEHVPEETIRQGLIESGEEPGMKAAGEWPWAE